MSTVEDREEIRQLLARYCHATDGGRVDEWVAMFTDDGVFDAAGKVMEGADALRSFAAGLGGGMRHVVANEVIDVDGDEATVQAYIVLIGAGLPTGVMTGTYDDRLRRVDGRWRFTSRTFTPDRPPA